MVESEFATGGARGDRIRLEGMIFYGYHGVDAAEKALGQRFSVDVELERDLRLPGARTNWAIPSITPRSTASPSRSWKGRART
ncbi:MAG TPA: dihydroneopterin aldolase [Chloroflexota bacterium]|nr:dihydroneopterin aldolase [Chloroflexota bacterium]